MRWLALSAIPAMLGLFAMVACGGSASSPGAPADAGNPPPSPSAAATATTTPASPPATALAPVIAEPRELTTVYFVHAGW